MMEQLLRVLRRFFQKRLSGRDIIVFCSFCFLSFLMWYFFSLRMPCEAKFEIPVSFVYDEGVLFFKDEVPKTVSIHISDIGNRLRKIDKTRLFLEISVSEQVKTLEGRIVVSHEELVQHIMQLFSETVVLKSVEPTNFSFSYYVQKKREVPVILSASFNPLPQHSFSNEPELLQNQVDIIGSSSVVDTVKAVHTSGEVFTLRSDTEIIAIPLVIPEGVSVTQNSVKVRVCTEEFTEKKFMLPVEVQRVPKKCNVKVFPSSAQVIVKVATHNFDLIKEEDFHLCCLFPSEEDVSVLPLYVTYENPYVLQVRSLPQDVEYIIER